MAGEHVRDAKQATGVRPTTCKPQTYANIQLRFLKRCNIPARRKTLLIYSYNRCSNCNGKVTIIAGRTTLLHRVTAEVTLLR